MVPRGYRVSDLIRTFIERSDGHLYLDENGEIKVATANNTTILAQASLVGTSDYQQFIDSLSQQSTQQVVQTLFDPMNRIYKNQFCDFLINRIGYTWVKHHAFENRLAVFKRGNLDYGNTVQLLGLDWIRTHEYSEDEPVRTDDGDSLFKTYRPQGKAAYVSTNQFRQYPISVSDRLLRQAFASDTGLSEFVSEVMQTPFNSDNYAEYRAMINSFAAFNAANPNLIYRINTTEEPTTQEQARDFLVTLKALAERFYFPNDVRQFTPGDLPGTYTADQLVLLVTPEVNAVLDVQGLATLFHIERAEVPYRVIVVDDFGIPGCFGALVSDRTLLAMDQTYENGSFYNPRTLVTSYFLTHIQIAGVVDPFEPMILFGSGDAFGATSTLRTVTETASGITMTVSPETVRPGRTARITLSLTGTMSASEGEVPESLDVRPDSATYEVTAASGSTAVELDTTDTYVDVRTNRLHVGSDVAKGTVLTIKATGTYRDPTKTDTPTTPFTSTATVTVG